MLKYPKLYKYSQNAEIYNSKVMDQLFVVVFSLFERISSLEALCCQLKLKPNALRIRVCGFT